MINMNLVNGKPTTRKHYIDNIRWATIVLVIIYHVIYNFNSVGVFRNLNVKGIPQMDVLLTFVYPWFMALLFVVAGMSARYALMKRSNKTFLKERAKRILIPSIAGIFILGWINGWVTNQYVDLFGGNGGQLPSVIKWLIYCLCGIGPLWFAHELFLASVILVILRCMDQKDRLWKLGKKTNYVAFILLVFVIWGSSMILNTPMITMYRNGIYIFMFLLGYYVFSHEEVTDRLVKVKVPILVIALLTGVIYTITYYGENYTSDSCLQSFFTNAYLWLMILAILGCAKAWWDQSNRFTEYMVKRNFAFYILHYPFLVLIAYLVVTYLKTPILINYFLILILEAILLPLLYEMISRIPILRALLLGIYQSNSKGHDMTNKQSKSNSTIKDV